MYLIKNNSFSSNDTQTNLKTFSPKENKSSYVKEFILSDINSDINTFTSSDVPILIAENKNFESNLNDQFYNKFVNFMMLDEIPEDYTSAIEFELLDYFKKNPYVTGNWFSSFFTKFINNSKFLVNLLKILAKLECDAIPNMHLCITSLLSNKDIEVKDFAIRVLESWADSVSLNILKNTEVTPEWLESYKQSVVEDLNSTLLN